MCFTIDALLHPDNPVTQSVGHRDALSGCTVESPHMAVVHFKQTMGFPQEWLTLHLMPAAAFDHNPVIPVDHPFGRAAYGSQGMRGELTETGARFWDADGGERPLIKHWELRKLEDRETALAEVEAGRAHGLISVPHHEHERLHKDPVVALKTYDLRTSWFLAPNPELPRDVRAALDASLDRSAIRLRFAAVAPNDPNPPIEPISGPFVQSSPYYNRAVPIPEADLERAAKLRDKAGFERAVRIAVRREAHEVEPALLDAIVVELQGAGWTVEPQVLDADASLDGFDLLLSTQSFGTAETPRFLAVGGSVNPFGTMPRHIHLIAKQWWAADNDTDAKDAMHDLHRALAEEYLFLGLFKIDNKSAWRAEIRNNTIAPFHYFTEFGNWRLDPEAP